MTRLVDRYTFVLRCKDCGNELTMSDEAPSEALGDPVPSELNVEGKPDLTRSIFKRMVMLWVPDVCPVCSNLRSAAQ